MANALQLRRGTTTQHSTFTGLAGEVTVDTDKDTVVVHDGATAGGIPLATEDSVSAANLLTAIKTVDGAGSGLDADLLDGQTGTYYTNYADTAVANLVASAPSTLDTLNELAAALGDDPNFATTVTNSIATKLDSSSYTAADVLTKIKTVDGSGSGLNADYVDGVHASQFLRSDTNDQLDAIIMGSDGNPLIQLNSGAAYFGSTSRSETNFAISSSTGIKANVAGNKYTMWHAGNDGASSGLDADMLDGLHASTFLRGDVDDAVSGIMEFGNAILIEEVVEKVATSATTSGTINFDVRNAAINNYSTNQTANRTINFRASSAQALNSFLDTGKSVTVTALMQQGSTAYYLNAYQVDGTAVTPKWSGGSAPTGGNASGIDVYTFTIIKTANATFTVLASVVQYA